MKRNIILVAILLSSCGNTDKKWEDKLAKAEYNDEIREKATMLLTISANYTKMAEMESTIDTVQMNLCFKMSNSLLKEADSLLKTAKK